MTLADHRVTLAVSGGIASYKACTIARQLTEAGATVDTVMTASAAEFVRPVTFEALTGRPVLTSMWERDRALAHIHLARDSDLIIIAPATANLLARAAQGMADDLLSAILLARTVPVLAAPAMNDRMFAHPATQANLAKVREIGWHVVGPVIGPLAEGPSELPGRMSEPEEIVTEARRILRSASSNLSGKKTVVTAGPTRESLDAVRVITNKSSGRMGHALAAAAYERGASVTLVIGPTALKSPYGVQVIGVESTEEMLRAVASRIAGADLLIMSAAPADFRPRQGHKQKHPREGGLELQLEATPDILEDTIRLRGDHTVTVGFALETEDGVGRSREKLRRKKLDMIVLNHADEEGAGFEVETNRVTIITDQDETELPLMSKREVAERILDIVEKRL